MLRRIATTCTIVWCSMMAVSLMAWRSLYPPITTFLWPHLALNRAAYYEAGRVRPADYSPLPPGKVCLSSCARHAQSEGTLVAKRPSGSHRWFADVARGCVCSDIGSDPTARTAML